MGRVAGPVRATIGRMKRRLAAAFVVLVAGAAAAVAYTDAVRDREYRRLVAAGETALAS